MIFKESPLLLHDTSGKKVGAVDSRVILDDEEEEADEAPLVLNNVVMLPDV